ncbi:septum formation initiator family protein [Flavobacterium sp. SUN052]|uniref:FtsB family cell division protein n=1 Tax=Flavobacterium sp. SUN052 TaxID=3002441 RepID=UPI00237E9A5B|nr:septum formation initiator family protein [Flavobacterium sp. SUN052]MEC4003862.1 septum formation initiator family protein [Flavobacterium sp. SUN052]
MKKWYQNLIANYPFLKFLGNRYTLVMLFFIVWMLFLDNQSYWDQRSLNKQIDELEDNKSYYQQEIAKDEQSIKNLKNPGQTERYAREKYYMKKDSEDIYIIDIEEDRIKDSLEEAKQ